MMKSKHSHHGIQDGRTDPRSEGHLECLKKEFRPQLRRIKRGVNKIWSNIMAGKARSQTEKLERILDYLGDHIGVLRETN